MKRFRCGKHHPTHCIHGRLERMRCPRTSLLVPRTARDWDLILKVALRGGTYHIGKPEPFMSIWGPRRAIGRLVDVIGTLPLTSRERVKHKLTPARKFG